MNAEEKGILTLEKHLIKKIDLLIIVFDSCVTIRWNIFFFFKIFGIVSLSHYKNAACVLFDLAHFNFSCFMDVI